MKLARTSALLMSILVGACVTSGMPAATDRELITGDNLRSLVEGKIVAFPRGEALTDYECYVFGEDSSSLACSGRDLVDYGRFVVSHDRVCLVRDDSLCWQFLGSRSAGYQIRHLAFKPGPADEPVCIEEWTGGVEDCRLPSASD